MMFVDNKYQWEVGIEAYRRQQKPTISEEKLKHHNYLINKQKINNKLFSLFLEEVIKTSSAVFATPMNNNKNVKSSKIKLPLETFFGKLL